MADEFGPFFRQGGAGAATLGAAVPVGAIDGGLAPAAISLDRRIAVIGLGYVGLPLAVEFGRKFDTVGYDIDEGRIEQLRLHRDHTREVDAEQLRAAIRLRFAHASSSLADRTTFVVTVPTPIDRHKRPDLSPLVSASAVVGRNLKRGDVVIYESTVYPGATEEICVPVLERESGLRFNIDFYCGYSPERINPGDKLHRLADIRKVTAGSTKDAAVFVDELYRSIIAAGTFRASSIRVAEAAKVIENTQRDLNIALVNEFALIFNRLGIDTGEVLQAAATKWNFLPFQPGLVGGHCIGVDPYYLTHKAQEIGYHPEVILAGRRINDGMGGYVAAQVVRLMARRRIHIAGARVLVLGFTFKENCPDVRNTRVIDIVEQLRGYDAEVEVHDPWAERGEVLREYGIATIDAPAEGAYDAVILAVAHDEFRALGGVGVRAFGKPQSVVFDVKAILAKETVDARL